MIVAGGSLGTLGAHHGTWKILGATVLATVINAIDGYHIWTDATARLPRGA